MKKLNCEYCNNVSGQYKRELSDWVSLCPGCNHKDGVKVHSRFKEAVL